MAPLGLADWYLIAVALPVGSFIGTVIDRLPADEAVPVGARAQCAACGAALTARDLVPLASWLATRGRCRHCGVWIGWFYPAVELAALGIALAALAADRGFHAWVDAGLGWWLLALGWIDWRHRMLPDVLTLPLIVFGLAAAGTFEPDSLPDPLLGAVCGYLAIRVAAWAYRRLRGRAGVTPDAAKLLAAAGAWVGVTGLPSVALGALLAAAGVALVMRARSGTYAPPPVGACLAAATWLVWLCGPVRL